MLLSFVQALVVKKNGGALFGQQHPIPLIGKAFHNACCSVLYYFVSSLVDKFPASASVARKSDGVLNSGGWCNLIVHHT